MIKKHKKPLAALIAFSSLSLILGTLFLLFACHGECGSDVHGGMFTWVCPRFYVPISACIVMMIAAVLILAAIILTAVVSKRKHSI